MSSARLFWRLGSAAAGLLVALAILAPAAADRDEGTVTQFPIITPSDVLGITTGPDGNVWFTTFRGNTVGRMTPSGQVSEWQIPTPFPLPFGITAGPDGNVWFTQSGSRASQISRITPGGEITEFPLPTGISSPTRITQGPDGNLWFTAEGPATVDRRIGRITPSGQVATFLLPAGSIPTDIASGPDGHLWIALNQTSFLTPKAIVKMRTDGAILDEYSLGSQTFSNQIPRRITSGPDDALWFTFDSYVGRITTDGDISVFNVPSGGGIITGHDGNLWLAQVQDRRLARMTTDGVVTSFGQIEGPPSPRPNEIVWGPDANLWFSLQFAPRVGRMTVDPAAAVLLSPESGSACTPIAVSGQSFAAFEPVRVTPAGAGLHERARHIVVRADARGAFEDAPMLLPPKSLPGDVTLTARGESSGLVRQGTYTVTEACA